MRPRAVLPVLLLLVVTGCGGGDKKSDSPEATPTAEDSGHPLVGTWDATSVVDRTDLTGKGNTKGSKDQLALVISCLDEECTQLATRAGLVSGSLSRTITLTVAEDTEDTASGERTRTGPCNQTTNKGKPGRYTETAAYSWSVDGDDLTGDVDYTFKGCGYDGSSHLAVTVNRTDPLPTYLPSEETDSLAGPVTAYDADGLTLLSLDVPTGVALAAPEDHVLLVCAGHAIAAALFFSGLLWILRYRE